VWKRNRTIRTDTDGFTGSIEMSNATNLDFRNRHSIRSGSAWTATVSVTASNGEVVSHQQDIGRIRKSPTGNHIGKSRIRALKALKKAVDPNNIVNPGVLLPHV